MKKFLLAMAMIGTLFTIVPSCVSNGSIRPLEEMTDLEFNRWKLYIQLGVKVGANRLLQEGIVTTDQLSVVAGIVESVKSGPVVAGASSLIVPALHKAGFNNDEVELVLLIAEQELLARGAFDWLNPATGTLELSPRTKEVLDLIADSLRTAGTVTPQEQTQASQMNANFCRQ